MRRVAPALILLACTAIPGCTTGAPADQPPAAQAGSGAIPPDAQEPGRVSPGIDPLRSEQRDFSRHFAGVEGTFVLLDPANGRIVRHNAERARTRFIPASTFKIPNTLIALETGVADGPDFALAWDSTVAPRQGWWPASWPRDHTLRTALPASAVWFYQELARRIGPERMRGHLTRWDYGNADISGGIDQFWLSGGLRISPDEQVEFLARLYHNQLGASQSSTDLVKQLLTLEETRVYRLAGKTGWAGLGESEAPDVGWLVGWLERNGAVYFYATNIDIRENDDASRRLPITRAILQELGLLPAS